MLTPILTPTPTTIGVQWRTDCRITRRLFLRSAPQDASWRTTIRSFVNSRSRVQIPPPAPIESRKYSGLHLQRWRAVSLFGGVLTATLTATCAITHSLVERICNKRSIRETSRSFFHVLQDRSEASHSHRHPEHSGPRLRSSNCGLDRVSPTLALRSPTWPYR